MTQTLASNEYNKRYVIYRVDCAVLQKLTKRTNQFETLEDAERGIESHIRNVYEIQCIMKKIKFNEDEYAQWRSSYDTQFVIMEYQGPYKTRIVKLIN